MASTPSRTNLQASRDTALTLTALFDVLTTRGVISFRAMVALHCGLALLGFITRIRSVIMLNILYAFFLVFYNKEFTLILVSLNVHPQLVPLYELFGTHGTNKFFDSSVGPLMQNIQSYARLCAWPGDEHLNLCLLRMLLCNYYTCDPPDHYEISCAVPSPLCF